MKRKLLQLTRKKFVRNVMIMATGTAAAQVITMALSPIITRMYGPEAFGVLGVFLAIVGILAPIAALTYPIAIVLPRNDSEAKGLIRLSIYISLVISGTLGLMLLFFNRPIVSILQIEIVAPFLYLIPVFVLFSGFLQVAEQWLIRTKQFGITAKVAFLQALILQVSKVGIGIFYPIATVLVVLSVLGQALRALMMIVWSNSSTYRQSTKELYKEEFTIKQLAKKHKDFPLFRAPQVLIYAATQSLPILLLSIFFGPASAGFYSLSRSTMSIPAHLIGKSVGDVFYPRITEAAKNGENLTNLIKRAIFTLAVIGILPFGIVVAFGPTLFSFVFGIEWVIAGEYARWISLGLYFMFIYQPCIKAFPVLSAQAFHLKFTIFTLVIQLLALITGYLMFTSDLIGIAFFGISNAILSILLIIFTIDKTKKFDMTLS